MQSQSIQLSIPGMTGARRPSFSSQYRKELLARTASSRVVSGLSREQVVEAINVRYGFRVKLATYKKWETRTPIPHSFIIPFCDVVHADPYMLLTGKPFRLGRTQTTLQEIELLPAAKSN